MSISVNITVRVISVYEIEGSLHETLSEEEADTLVRIGREHLSDVLHVLSVAAPFEGREFAILDA